VCRMACFICKGKFGDCVICGLRPLLSMQINQSGKGKGWEPYRCHVPMSEANHTHPLTIIHFQTESYTHMCTNKHTDTYAHTHTHTHTHICTHTHTRTQTHT